MKEISLHILDVVQNSIEAGASRVSITVAQDSERDLLTVEIADNGRGMSPEMVERVADPFVTTRTTRRVGLGLPLFAATARQSGGQLTVDSVEGEGTRVTATFKLGNVDRPPLGDMASTLACLLASSPSLDITYLHRCDGREFVVSPGSLAGKLTGLSQPALYRLVHGLVGAGLEEVCGRPVRKSND